jgi:putative sterol carrier protein
LIGLNNNFQIKKMIDVKKFLTDLPTKVNPAAIEGLSSLFHFDIDGAGQYTVALNDGKLDVKEGIHGDNPSCKVTTSTENFAKLLSGDLNPMMAMMTGKLKISNPGEMLKYAKTFGIM